MTRQGISFNDQKLLTGDKDISKSTNNIQGFLKIMPTILSRLSKYSRDEYLLQKKINSLTEYSRIAQAARDGIILQQETRKEKSQDGTEVEVKYDTSMSPNEVISLFSEYDRLSDNIGFNKLNNYLSLGLGLAGTIGSLVSNNNSSKDDSTSKNASASILTFGSTVAGALKLFNGLRKPSRGKIYDLQDEQRKKQRDLFENEQVSSLAESDTIDNITSLADQERIVNNKIENKRFMYDLILDLAVILISGAYINSNVKFKENGKIDGKSLASALLNLESQKGIIRSLTNAAEGMVKTKNDAERLDSLYEKIKDILNQMEEKVYPLEGASKPFNSLSINDFSGRFYPKKDYTTGETTFSTTIEIPEFSMKRGDVVLLSGESGAGKSTFLRFLKRGDINNRNEIKLDTGEKVDHLGDQYLSFRPSINLGNESNVLYQLTGKQNISDLTEEESNRLQSLLRELKFDDPNLLNQLASKNFSEFSTGQQRRLALSKLFYRIDDATSVIIVDEPVGNVEDTLIREQLEMIKKYAESKNIMLLLTTHRLDLAEDLATKRYHIKDGVLQEIPIKNRSENKDLEDTNSESDYNDSQDDHEL